MTAIGFLRPDRLTCAEAPHHLPGCHNPWVDETWCLCGEVRWPGNTGVWRCVERHRLLPFDPPRGIGMASHGANQPVLSPGWDTYWMDGAA